MPISRLHTFNPNTTIILSDLLGELEQIYRLLNGALADRVILKQNSANLNLIIANTIGKLLELKQNGVTRFSINQAQQIVFNQDLVSAPIQVDSITKVTNLNATYLDDLDLSRFILNNTKHIESFFNLFLPGNTSATTDKGNDYIIPAGTTMVLKELRFACDRIFDNSFVQVSARKNGVTMGTLVQLDGGTGNNANLQTINISVVENDIISLLVEAITLDTLPISNIRVRIKFKQELVN